MKPRNVPAFPFNLKLRYVLMYIIRNILCIPSLKRLYSFYKTELGISCHSSLKKGSTFHKALQVGHYAGSLKLQFKKRSSIIAHYNTQKKRRQPKEEVSLFNSQPASLPPMSPPLATSISSIRRSLHYKKET